jgi:hypothetical protein
VAATAGSCAHELSQSASGAVTGAPLAAALGNQCQSYGRAACGPMNAGVHHRSATSTTTAPSGANPLTKPCASPVSCQYETANLSNSTHVSKLHSHQASTLGITILYMVNFPMHCFPIHCQPPHLCNCIPGTECTCPAAGSRCRPCPHCCCSAFSNPHAHPDCCSCCRAHLLVAPGHHEMCWPQKHHSTTARACMSTLAHHVCTVPSWAMTCYQSWQKQVVISGPTVVATCRHSAHQHATALQPARPPPGTHSLQQGTQCRCCSKGTTSADPASSPAAWWDPPRPQHEQHKHTALPTSPTLPHSPNRQTISAAILLRY